MLAIADVWIGGILALVGALIGAGAGAGVAVWVDIKRRAHEDRVYWRERQFAVVADAERFLGVMEKSWHGSSLGLHPDPDPDPDPVDFVNEMIGKLQVLLPRRIVQKFKAATDACHSTGMPTEEFYSRWREFTEASMEYLGIDL